MHSRRRPSELLNTIWTAMSSKTAGLRTESQPRATAARYAEQLLLLLLLLLLRLRLLSPHPHVSVSYMSNSHTPPSSSSEAPTITKSFVHATEEK